MGPGTRKRRLAHDENKMPDLRFRNHLGALLMFLSVCALLYFGREVLLPLVLATLFCFLLAPIVNRLESLGLGRKLAVICTSVFSACLLFALLYVLVAQVLDFVSAVPGYRENLRAKAASIHASENGVLARALETFRDFGRELSPTPPAVSRGAPNGPLAVEVVDAEAPAVSLLRRLGGNIFGPLGTAAIVAIFVIFMLIDREELRDRVIHLVGKGRLRLTTQAMDDAAQRVSRYLLAQSVVNGTYGLSVGLGLYLIGIPSAVLWGILAAVFRFVPYLGPWIGAACPLLVAFAMSPGWSTLVFTLILFFALEVITGNVIEPWLYGTSTGISPMAVLVSSVFWAWLWGLGGLLLATPLTVCFVVLGKHVPGLEFIEVMLGDKPPIARESRFYQRLLAGDEAELREIAEKHEEEGKIGELFDEIVLPALRQAEEDFSAGVLDRNELSEIYERIRTVLRSLAGFDQASSDDAPEVLLVPARNQGDELAGRMVAYLMHGRDVRVQVLSSGLLNAEIAPLCQGEQPPRLMISALTESRVQSAPALARRLLGGNNAGRAIIGVWGRPPDSPLKGPDGFVVIVGGREAARYAVGHRRDSAPLAEKSAAAAKSLPVSRAQTP